MGGIFEKLNNGGRKSLQLSEHTQYLDRAENTASMGIP